MQKFDGENVIRAYRKRYSVDWLCAIKKLKMLGVEIDPGYVRQLEQTVEEQFKVNRKRKLEKQRADEALEWENKYPDSDENFYFIAGYTSGGMPYGITWEEAKSKDLLEDEE